MREGLVEVEGDVGYEEVGKVLGWGEPGVGRWGKDRRWW